MGLTIYVAVIALAMKGCAGRTSDATLYTVWAPSSILLGLAAFWAGRGFLAAATAQGGRASSLTCPKCGRGTLQTLAREWPGRPAVWVGSRCRFCGTTFRRVEGQLVGFEPERRPGPEPGIRFEEEGEGVRYLDEPPA